MKLINTGLLGMSLLFGAACADNSTASPRASQSDGSTIPLHANSMEKNQQSFLNHLRHSFPQYANSNIIIVDVSSQNLRLYSADNIRLGTFKVSTATNGAGSEKNSGRTPLGAHRVSQVFGEGAAPGAIFKARQNTGKIAKIIREPIDVKTDDVTTRILWLDGLEPGKNKGGNVDSHQRFIYIHGTPEEGLIGQPASHGCIRMYNADVIKLFDYAPVNTLVYIQN